MTRTYCVLAVVSTVIGAGYACSGAVAPPPSLEPPSIAKPLLAHWAFDEDSESVARDWSGSGYDASLLGGQGRLSRTEGVHGSAISFSGHHMLGVPGGPDFARVQKLSLSAWVLPMALDKERYREIFRKEDGDQRVLFSFQEHGTVLSLGLNVGGYAECDATITPAQLLDGSWHHCAATFDGQRMRVYLDGKEIGSLERSGALAAGGSAPGCIGSSNGGECFQGAMDDLRIYKDALTADDVATLYRHGLRAQEKFHRDAEADLQAFFTVGKTFAETLTASRRRFVEKAIPATPRLLAALRLRLKAAFPDDFDRFVAATGISPVDYVVARGNSFNVREVGRLVEMMAEYKPLTEAQWKRQSPDDLARWKEAEAIEKRFEALKAQGEAAAFSPDWIELMMEAARRVTDRPRVQEAVAPYVKPSTPETRNLSADEARQTLERDWLHQADNHPTLERIRAEIGWTRALAERITECGVRSADCGVELAELAAMERQLTARSRDAYFKVREIKRRIAFKNPVVNFTKVLFVDMPFPQGSEWPHETRHRLGYMAVPGGRLLVLDGLSPEGKLTQLMPQPPFHGSFWRPDLSWDASKVLFCFKPHNEKSFHLYEINTDGTGLRQLTDGIYDDLDPIYLPDGEHIIFTTTRGHTYVRCMPPTNAYVLARCDRDGRNIYLISANNEPDYLPSVMNDGRIVYTRWEYTDKPLWRAQGLWTVNPDGTHVSTLWGNQSVWPDLLKDARSIPGSRRVMFTGSAHHNWFSGSVGILTPGDGFNFPAGLTKVTADVAWPESGNGPIDPIESPAYHRSGHYAAYYSPYPLSERDFLVSANRGGKFVLYLMDTDGNRELVYEGVNNIFHAIPLRPRLKPPVIQDRVEWPTRDERSSPKNGVIYSGNVYSGAPQELRGKARFLRVLTIDHKTYTYWHKRPYLSTGPVVSAVQSEGVKRVLGTVPIETDGSLSFHAPSGIPLHFQLLDGQQRALQTMRSFVNVMPGERRGCLGCHELHSVPPDTPLPLREGVGGGSNLANGSTTLSLPSPWKGEGYEILKREPSRITPPPWGSDTVSWDRYVRPVLDRHCARCHTGDGKGRAKVDMTPRPGGLGFDETYWLFTGRPAWGAAYVAPKNPPPGFGIADMLMVEGYDQRDPRAYETPPPMTRLSYKSRLIDIASSGKHHDVKLPPDDLLRLILWVDAMCPYLGDQEVRAIDDPEFQGVDWLAIRPRIKTAPRIIRPGPAD